ncbi:MAG: B12-binding domain-containing radical SAM protein, partial [Candidatus Binatia bacterium]
WPCIEELITGIRRAFPDTPLIVGGEHATATWQYILESCPGVTGVGLGEGEETICDLAKWADQGGELDTIPGIAYRREGQAVTTGPRTRIRSVDDIPLPAWDLTPLEAYLDNSYSFGVDLGRSMPLLATRGCPYRCTFCSSPLMWTTRYYMRSPGQVVDEIESYLHRYKTTNIDFYDLTAIIKKEWILQFCDEILRRGLKFTWQLPTGTRSEALDGEALPKLFAAGCRNLTYAPESGSDRTLQEIKKKVHLPRMIESMQAAKRAGLSLKCNLIIGFPKERRVDVWRTLRFALKMAWLGVDDVPLYMFSPYPGTELYEYLRSNGAIPQMDNDYFRSLTCINDFSQSSRYCERISPLELNCYRIVGMMAFYAVSFLRHPSRLLRTIRHIWSRSPSTILEQRLIELLRRRSLLKREQQLDYSLDAHRTPAAGG